MPDFSLAHLGVPAVLVGALVVIAMATLALHLLFPPIKRSRHAGLQLRRIHCPLCHERLDRFEWSGISAQTCPQCKGVWLSRDALERLGS